MYRCLAALVLKNLDLTPFLLLLYNAHVKHGKPTLHSNIATIYVTIAVKQIKASGPFY